MIFLFFMEFKFNLKKITKWFFYIVYLILSLELISFLTIKVLFFSNKILERNINNFLSDNVSKFVPDLRSDYKQQNDNMTYHIDQTLSQVESDMKEIIDQNNINDDEKVSIN